jgi:hypothetical protein
MKTTKSTQITELEKQVIAYCIYNDFLDGDNPVGTPVWYIEEDDVDMEPGQLSGVVSSCLKKGFITIDKDGKDSTITLTQLGLDMYNK